MDKRKKENAERIGSVKAAINRYGKQINQATDAKNRFLNDASVSQERASKAQELHIAKNRIYKINEDRKVAETVKSLAELELIEAKKMVRDLTSQIEESKKAKQKAEELQTLNKVKRVGEERALESVEVENECYMEVMRNLKTVKRELSKIKLDMARAKEEKSCAEEEAEAAGLRLMSYTSTAEKLRREIEDVNEEEVLVELAQIQARKELAEIEAQRKEEAEKFSSLIQETRKKISLLRNEVEQIEHLKDSVAVTNSDAEMLQNELKLIKEMDNTSERNSLVQNSDLLSVTEDVEAARKELASIKAQAFQLMKGMDLIRIELNDILEEKGRMEKAEVKTEKLMKNLNSKLLRAQDRLEAAKASNEKANSMLPSFLLSLQELEKVKEASTEEKARIIEETVSIREDIQKTESETDSAEERLQAALQELEEVKTSEAHSLKRLKVLVEKAVVLRACKNTSNITISKFEYDYLTGCASEAEEVADKKVAAAHAWADALKANEKEMKTKTDLAERKIKELRLEEDQVLGNLEKSLSATDLPESETQKQNSYSLTPVRQTKFRRSVGSPAARRVSTSTSLTAKRRRKAMIRVAKYFASEQIENKKSVSPEEEQ